VPTDPRVKRRQRQGAERLGRLLRDAREKAGLTQDAVAEQLGRPHQYLSAAELGRQRLDLGELLQICGVIGVPVGDVIRRYELRA
jgi:transcriptional regulator with XRE-family HTH domain